MPQTEKHSRRRVAREITRIFIRDAFLPINAIILTVVLLLIIFGQTREGISLAIIVFFNIALGFGQDVRAWFLLERVQLLSVPNITRIEKDGTDKSVALEMIAKGDRLRLTLGDQMPCDGTVESSASLEVNEGLITGESDSLPQHKGMTIIAGSIVTAGTGIVVVATSFEESRMAKMAHGLERYTANPSPIQQSVQTIIQYTIYVLIVVGVFVVGRGLFIHEAAATIVEQIGALAGVLVPQGLVVSTTLLFTFGAWHFYNRNVLLQEVNATEKFGRIKNLCMDKTGTLTTNELTVEQLLVPTATSESAARELAALYVHHSGDLSLSIRAIGTFLGPQEQQSVSEALAFSSWRKYGGILIGDSQNNNTSTIVLVGSSEAFEPFVRDTSERAWLVKETKTAATEGKHVLCIVRANMTHIPQKLTETNLTVVGIFVLSNKLREGVHEAIDFFQSRGVTVRILSGDNTDTVRAIAAQAGVKNTDAFITGVEMKEWTTADYQSRAHHYAIFARIEPEQKEHIIDALKLDGFTAMVGDGANDALSVKKADLGIAIFGGATATRQIAAVVLMHNSFVELPAGVRLAASMIENIEIFSSIFLNQTMLQFLLFVSFTLLGTNFPFTPLSVAFMNYFTVGFVGILISFWAVNPREHAAPTLERSFLSRVLPITFALSLVQLCAMIALIVLGSVYVPRDSIESLVIVGVVALSFSFLAIIAEVFSGGLSYKRRLNVFVFALLEALMLFVAFKIPLVTSFFGITAVSTQGVLLVLAIALGAALAQLALTKLFFRNS